MTQTMTSNQALVDLAQAIAGSLDYQTKLLQSIESTNQSAAERVAIALERIASALESQSTSEIIKDLSAYPGFDWGSIGATIKQRDKHGAVAVEHGGKIYTRRNPANKFGIAIWYSRSVGKGEDGSVSYERLISFREIDVAADPLNDRTVSKLRDLMQQASEGQ